MPRGLFNQYTYVLKNDKLMVAHIGSTENPAVKWRYEKFRLKRGRSFSEFQKHYNKDSSMIAFMFSDKQSVKELALELKRSRYKVLNYGFDDDSINDEDTLRVPDAYRKSIRRLIKMLDDGDLSLDKFNELVDQIVSNAAAIMSREIGDSPD